MHEVRKWLIIASLQLDRLRTSWSKLSVEEKRIPKESAWITDPGIPEWVKAQEIMWGDLHFLYIALNNLFKAVNKVENLPRAIINMNSYKELKSDIKMLRDIHEHWDKNEEEVWALKEFKKSHTKVDPRSIGLMPFKKFEAGGLDINEIQSLILKLEDELGTN